MANASGPRRPKNRPRSRGGFRFNSRLIIFLAWQFQAKSLIGVFKAIIVFPAGCRSCRLQYGSHRPPRRVAGSSLPVLIYRGDRDLFQRVDSGMKVTPRELEIDSCIFESLMAHQYLNRAQVGAGLEQVRRITVAQGVRVDLLRESGTRRYSAAGHPPLLHWKCERGELRQVESNGLLFGVVPEPAYPVVEFPIWRGDRLLLYTDGFTEPENSNHEAFGDHQLEAVLRQHTSSTPPELSLALLSALQTWQAPSSDQQDDITLIVVDVFDLIDSLPGPRSRVHSDSAEEEWRFSITQCGKR
jgi:Stage II sporulation protein E (SpoIIE)